VVVIFLDVRGFSSFAKIAESTDAAEFLTSTYTKILDSYVPDAAFFKLTGDGMMILYDYDRDSLTEVVQKAINVSLRLIDEFPTITDGDPMINFSVPKDLGIGLARGAATVIAADQFILDYSGRPLNLAARLMDLARPSGLVLDASFGFNLLTQDVQNKFKQTPVYVREIADKDPILVYYLADRTEIPEQNKFPLNRHLRVMDGRETILIKELLERSSRFSHHLSQEPAKTDDIQVHLSYPRTRPDGTPDPKIHHMPSYPAAYKEERGHHWAVVDYVQIGKLMTASDRTDPTWNVDIVIEYSVHDVKNEHQDTD
jgi:class 3 adenylate cyclase